MDCKQMTSTQQLHDELLEGYLLQTREQIQQDLLTLIDSDDQKLNDKMCQIVVDNFDKFFPNVKWNSQTIKLKLLLVPLVF